MDALGGRVGKEALQRKMAEKFLESDAAEALLSILTTVERRLVAAVVEQHDLLDVDGLDEVPDPDERAARLRSLWQAKMSGEFPAWWVEHYADLEHPGEAAQFANEAAEEWETTKGEWAARYRRQDMEGSDEELANAHTQARYGVPLDEFERVVIEWPDERHGDELQAVIAGPVEAAIGGIEASNDHLRERED